MSSLRIVICPASGEKGGIYRYHFKQEPYRVKGFPAESGSLFSSHGWSDSGGCGEVLGRGNNFIVVC